MSKDEDYYWDRVDVHSHLLNSRCPEKKNRFQPLPPITDRLILVAMKTYQYGLLAPTLNADLVREQMLRAHRYQNQLIELERWFRNEVRAIEGKAGNIPRLEEVVQAKQAAFDAIDKQIKRINAKARAKEAQKDKALMQAKRKSRTALKQAEKALIEARKIIREDEDIKASKAALKEQFYAKMANIRVSEEAPWYGTYMLVEDAFKRTRKMPYYDGLEPNDPRFRRFDRGRIGRQQFQPNEPISKVVGTAPTSLSVQILPCNTKPVKKDGITPRKVGKKDLRVLRLRINSDDKGKPIWAEFPMVLDRPLPAGSAIATIQVLCRKVAKQEKWTVSITVKEENSIPPKTEETAVTFDAIAFDLGWREYDDRVSIATYHTTDDKKGEISVAKPLLSQLAYVDTIKSIRDKEFDQIRAQLSDWLKEHATIVPKWLSKETEHLDKWRSKARLIKLIGKWEKERFAGDEEILGSQGRWDKLTRLVVKGNELLGWRSKDTHLWIWEQTQSRKARNRLRELYRIEAAKLADQYAIAFFEDINGANLARGKVAGRNRQLTAPFSFRAICKYAFTSRGGQYIEVNARKSSMICSECHHENEKTSNLMYVCENENCKKEIHRDENASEIVLERGLKELRERASSKQVPGTARANDIMQLGVEMVSKTIEEVAETENRSQIAS